MENSYELSFTAQDIDDKLHQVDKNIENISNIKKTMEVYEGRIQYQNLIAQKIFSLDSVYKPKQGYKFFIVFNSFNYNSIDRLAIFCNDEDGNDILHERLTPIIGEAYPCCTSKESSSLRINLIPTEDGGNIDLGITIFEENNIYGKIFENLYRISELRNIIGGPTSSDHDITISTTQLNTYATFDYVTQDDKEYTLKVKDCTSQYFTYLTCYLYNSNDDYIVIGREMKVGDSVTFKGNSDYKFLRIIIKSSQIVSEAHTVTVSFDLSEIETVYNRIESIEENIGTIIKNSPNVLILGDSYSKQGRWIEQLNKIISLGEIVNLGVSSATLKDKESDFGKYSYTSRPVSTNNTYNNNTFSCQIEWLKRLMEGEDLDDGENQVYTDHSPDIILIEGGTNDVLDDSMDAYTEELYTVKSGYIASRFDSDSIKSGYIKIPKNYTESNRTTFIGAMYYLYGSLHKLFPNALIFYITPCGLHYMSGQTTNYLEKGKQIKYSASLLSIPVIDWGLNGRLSICSNKVTGEGTETDPYIYDAMGEYANDSLHPNESGAKFLAQEVAKVLNQYHLVKYKR